MSAPKNIGELKYKISIVKKGEIKSNTAAGIEYYPDYVIYPNVSAAIEAYELKDDLGNISTKEKKIVFYIRNEYSALIDEKMKIRFKNEDLGITQIFPDFESLQWCKIVVIKKS